VKNLCSETTLPSPQIPYISLKNKNMDKILYLRNKFVGFGLLTFFFAVETWAQMPSVHVPQPDDESTVPVEDNTWWYITLFVLFLGLAGAVYWWHTTKKANGNAIKSTPGNQSKQAKSGRNFDSLDADNSFDADKELEWLRKNRTVTGKQNGNKNRETAVKNKRLNGNSGANRGAEASGLVGENSAGKTKETKFEELPIYSFNEIKTVAEHSLLPISNDSALMNAIEISQDESEDDEMVREIALRVLDSFKTRNSAECLGQMALYDLSSGLRSKAVAALADFDHESVFEDILLACADPTREVRASAARGLFRLSFDRADAWTRIIESKDEFRLRQAAKAALEADLVERSFDRLIHSDKKTAYEAFTFTALLVKAGETEEIFRAIENHRDKKVKLALLHVIKVVKDEATLPNLYTLLEQNSIPSEIKEKADDIIQSFGMVAA